MTQKLLLFTDGGSRGNPGPAGCGIFIADENMNPLKKGYRFLGETTNNIAEYTAIKIGIEKCIEMGATEIEVRADSKLAIEQLSGNFKIKNENLRRIFLEIQDILADWDGKITYIHIPREQNKEADRLSNVAMDKGMEKK
ncbi:MAG: ribonuclease HI family protein [Candidatus Gracilibacteria bacterium]|nr:ribonuclease HI family protein [Candidatus Gracilibacteria bacterium]